MYIKILGSLLIVLSGSLLGFLGSLKFAFRVNQLNELIQVLEIIKVEISFKKSLPDIFEELANKQNFKVSKIFNNVSKQLKENSYIDLENAWNLALFESMHETCLKKEDLEIIENLTIMIEKSDLECQVRNINYLIEKLKNKEKEAILLKTKNGKLLRAGGVLGSLALVIILF